MKNSCDGLCHNQLLRTYGYHSNKSANPIDLRESVYLTDQVIVVMGLFFYLENWVTEVKAIVNASKYPMEALAKVIR